MDAANQAPNCVEARQADQAICSLREEAAMHEEARPLPVALRCKDITEQELEALRRVAEDPNPTTGVLDWIPRRIAQRKREAVKN
jgi:hypothetical protein